MSSSNREILVVDDEASVRRLLLEVLKKEGYCVATAEHGARALEMMEETPFDLVVMDIRMPVMNGMEAFKVMSEKHPEVPVIMTTAYASVDTAVEAMKLGAFNYISKPFNNSEVKLNVKRALDIRNLTEELQELRQEVQTRFSLSNMIGNSGKMQEVYKIIGRVAATHATVLVQGESGTGKELAAKAIHYNSLRKEGPLVNINCATLPEGLLESELFGHEKGAFTGACARKRGKFETAHHGTLFLDEIGEMAPSLQAKLLRVIQDREFQRVGGLETIRCDVRIIAATNQDLEALIREGKFREDLYYRLNVVQIFLPPLRERQDDISLLVDYFLSRFNQDTGKDFRYISPEALSLLNSYTWPGNVRELENAIERAVVMGRGQVIMPEDLPVNLHASRERGHAPVEVGESSLKEILEGVEKRVIFQVLEETGWNRVHTSNRLKMSRKALIYKIEKYGLK